MSNSFDEIKDKICYKIINQERNQDFLNNAPYIPLASDLAVTFYIRFSNMFSKPIDNELVELFGLKNAAQILFEFAKQNTERLMPISFKSMDYIINDYLVSEMDKRAMEMKTPEDEQETKEFFEMAIDELNKQMPVIPYILTTQAPKYGAAALLYGEGKALLEKLNAIGAKGGFLAPSSIHEWVIIPDDGNYRMQDIINLYETVGAVNGDEELIRQQDILSDHIYYYNQFGLQPIDINLFERQVEAR